MEDLGFNFKETLQNTERALRNVDPKENSGIFDQIESFKLRQMFRSGNIRMMRVDQNISTKMPYQAQYYKLWISQLPIHRYYSSELPDPHTLMSETSRFLYQRSYRIGTLLGIVNPNDKDITKPTEMVERLYLWTWRWLVKPDAFPVQKVMAILRSPSFMSETYRLTTEDVQMVRNSLLWLSLFDSSSHNLAPLLNRFKVGREGQIPLFELENLVVEYLRALRDGHKVDAMDFRTQIENHILWESKDLNFKNLVCAVDEPDSSSDLPGHSLDLLVRNLKMILKHRNSQNHFSLVVDLTKFQLCFGVPKKKIFSPPMCLALDLLHSKSVVSCEEFVKVCFASNFYDSTYHNPKIFNLLSRIRDSSPKSLRFRMKTGYVIGEGSWQEIEFLKDNRVSEELKQQPEWRSLTTTGLRAAEELSTTPNISSLLKNQDRPIKRREFETLIKKSRSTANRILEKWIKEGFIKKVGNARSTRYLVLRPLESALKEEFLT